MTDHPSVGARDEVEALVADRYLDALLAAGDRRASDAPSDASLPPELRDAARVLRRALVRIHPSFRFEERLAGRLAELAAAGGSTTGIDGGAAVVAFPAPPEARAQARIGAPDSGDRVVPSRRPLLLGGALTSAAISIVGVAWVAWRATRPAGPAAAAAMGRAARAAHARRALATAGGAAGSGPRIGGPA